MQEQTQETVTRTANVSESKFNATATLRVRADSADMARTAAMKFFDDAHGARATKVVVEEADTLVAHSVSQKVFDVMVSDHSSGSLTDGDSFDFEMPVDAVPEQFRDGGDD